MDVKELKEQIKAHKSVLSKIALVAIIIIAFYVMLQQPVNNKYIGGGGTFGWIDAAQATVFISIISIVVGFSIGIVVGLARISRNFIINGIATVYVEILRGTPLLIQIFFIYYSIGPLMGLGGGLESATISAILALSINSGAYQAEIIRGGIQSIPRGQLEAARSSGMTYLQAMRHVILPQAFRLIIPPMTNEYVTVIKDSSLAYAIGTMEITWFSTRVVVWDFDPITTYLFVALMYFTLTTFTSNIMRFVEQRFRIPGYMVGE
jgi:His/Glu/Gln/Arg/opine family amino acid ABC transporter permease subunit